MTIVDKIHVLKLGNAISADGVETFHSKRDLEDLVESYNTDIHEAPVILGHDEDKNWAELLSSDSRPAYGWITKAYVDGNDLYVDVDASDELIQFIKDKKYMKRSLAYYGRDSRNNPTPGKLYMRHLAMLGASPPAIKGLKDIELAEGDNKEMATKEESVKLLNEQVKQWLAFLLKDDGRIVRENIIAFDPEPNEENNWLFNSEDQKFEGAFITDKDDRFVFEITQKPSGDSDNELDDDFIVSVKADIPDTEKEAEDDIKDEIEEVAESTEDVSEAEKDAAEALEDQEQNTFEEHTMAMTGKHIHDGENPEGIHDHPDIEERLADIEDKMDMEMAEKREYGDGSDSHVIADKGEDITVEDKGKEAVVLEEGACPECEEKMENTEHKDEEKEDDEDMKKKMQEMEEELTVLREKVRLQEEAEKEAAMMEVKKFSEATYAEGRLLESQIAEEDFYNLLVALMELDGAHMVFGEGEAQKNVFETVKELVTKLPEQVKFNESISEQKFVTQPKYDPKFSEESQNLDRKIRKAMTDAGYKSDDMIQYRKFYRQLA